ncbi:trace amine-associated receptor 13c-like [Rhineura floridana]|uniref:trace amine-associated receptor 13c-like n=1 Tax=Rhineura floridana TaxID=261503 RepID=UPI002AC84217|nr:trace amine-associated receptor 13c-like [Rhineura floridana]
MLGNSSGRSPNCTDWSQASAGDVCKLLLMALLVIAISLGNLVSLLVFFHVRQFRTSQGYLRVSLALADLAVGLIVVPYSVYREVNRLTCGMEKEVGQYEKLACFITGPIFAGCTFVSISTIFLLSVERCIAVLKPLHRKAVITKRRTLWLILASWTMSSCLAVIPLLSSPDITFQYDSCSKMCNYVFPTVKPPESHWNVMLLYPVFDFSVLSGTFAINAITFAAVHQYCKKRRQLGEESQGGNQLSFSDITAAKTIGILTFAFSSSFLPIAVFVVGSVVGYQWCQFSFYAFWTLTSNSCWNVAIYSIWDPKFRQGFRELFNKQVLIAASQDAGCSLEEHSSVPAYVAVLKKMFHPEST